MINILMVCTGNICRSPLAELVLRSRAAGLPITVTSAGTRARDGLPMTPEAAALAQSRGACAADVSHHQSKLLRPEHISNADLIVCMTRDHRREVVEAHPSSLRNAFTAGELARLAAEVSDEDLREIGGGGGGDAARIESPGLRLRAILHFLGQQRGTFFQPVSADQDDVVDPYRRSHATYERAASQLDPALHAMERIVRAAV